MTLSPFLLDVIRLTVWLTLLVAVFVPLERLFALKPEKIWRDQMGVDLAWYFINSLLPAALLAAPVALLVRTMHGFNPWGLHGMVESWPVGLKLVAALFVNDIGAYWMHRWQHKNLFLWRFHAVHHSAESLDWLVSTRAHPIDMVLVRLAGLVPVYLLGLGSPAGGRFDPVVAWMTVEGTFWSFLIHAHVRWRFGPLEWLIATPAFHHWHHTNDEHRDRNFAAIFPLLDGVFRTLYLPKAQPRLYGIDGYVAPNLWDQLLDPLLGPVRSRAATRKPEP